MSKEKLERFKYSCACGGSVRVWKMKDQRHYLFDEELVTVPVHSVDHESLQEAMKRREVITDTRWSVYFAIHGFVL